MATAIKKSAKPKSAMARKRVNSGRSHRRPSTGHGVSPSARHSLRKIGHREPQIVGRVCWANLINYVGNGFTSSIVKFALVTNNNNIICVTISGRRLISKLCAPVLIGNVLTLLNIRRTRAPINYKLPDVSLYYLMDDDSSVEAGPQGLAILLPILFSPVPIARLRSIINQSQHPVVDIVAKLIGVGNNEPGFTHHNPTNNSGDTYFTLVDQSLRKIHFLIKQDEYTFGQPAPPIGSICAIKFAQIHVSRYNYLLLRYGSFHPAPQLPQVQVIRDLSRFQLAMAPLV